MRDLVLDAAGSGPKILRSRGERCRNRTRATLDPLVLRANAGDCIKVTLTNRLNSSQGHASFHIDLVSTNPQNSLGIDVGNNPERDRHAGGRRTYAPYAEQGSGRR